VPLVDSSAIIRVEYDAAARALTVIFTTGRRYVYDDVPPGVYQAFLDAESQGRYFNACIRDRYRYHEL
jgi:hypothetical protein